jgi:hypothetical protein
VGLGFGRIFIGRSLFALTKTTIRTYNSFGRFLFNAIYTLARLISVKCLLLSVFRSWTEALALVEYELYWSLVGYEIASALVGYELTGLLPKLDCYILHSGWIGNALSKGLVSPVAMQTIFLLPREYMFTVSNNSWLRYC